MPQSVIDLAVMFTSARVRMNHDMSLSSPFTMLARLSQVVARMEKRGWVRRTPDPADGRYTLAILTGEGWATVTATAPGHVENVRRLVFDPLTRAQARQLRDICRRIMRAVDPDDRCLEAPPASTPMPVMEPGPGR